MLWLSLDKTWPICGIIRIRPGGAMSTVQVDRTLFDTVPNKDTFHLFNREGRPEGKRITNFLSYRTEDVAVATGIPKTSIRYDSRMPDDLKERLAQWAAAINLVGSFFNDEQKTMLWFQMPNPMLGNITPKQMIKMGRFKKLLNFIQNALSENEKSL